MKKPALLFILFIACASIIYSSCTDSKLNEIKHTPEIVREGILAFNDISQLTSTIEALRESDVNDINNLPITKAYTLNGEFVSLNSILEEKVLSSLTEQERSEVKAEGLVYEPEDSIINDPCMMAVLNANREIQVSDKIYRYVDNGLIIYDVNSSFNPNSATIPKQFEQCVPIEDEEGNIATYIPLEDSSNSSEPKPQVINYNGSLTLSDGMNIPADRVRGIKFKKEADDNNAFVNFLSSFFGDNAAIVNEFDDTHRMKLRMYNYNYLIYVGCGMTVRMQKKKFGIWWRTSAQEFAYGWTALEFSYDFDDKVIPVIKGNNSYTPDCLCKDVPYSTRDVVLFNIGNIDVSKGDMGKVLKQGLESIRTKINTWQMQTQNSSQYDRGLFTTKNEGRKFIIIAPQGDRRSYDKGRDAVSFENYWFPGEYKIGIGLNSDGQITSFPFSFKAAKKGEITGGSVYAAVKYNNVWKGCVIETCD